MLSHMIRRLILIVLAGILAIVIVAAGVLYAFLSNDGIRVALEGQATAWLGQPVKIASAGAQFWPRLGVTLQQVTVGEPARLTLAEVGLSTELSALLRRRIADGAIRVRNTRLELPLPFEIPTAGGEEAASEPSSFAIESINAIALENVRIVSRGRELVLSMDSSFDGARLNIRRATVDSGKTSIRAEGVLTLEPRVDAQLKASANRIDVDELLALADAFGPAAPPPGSHGTSGPPPRIAARISAEAATAGGVEVRQFASDVQVDGDSVAMSPLTFQFFGGRYQGSLAARLGTTLSATLRSRLLDLDVARLAEFGNVKDSVTGTLSGAGTFSGSGRDFAAVLAGARGSGTAKITNGTIRRLALVRTVVVFFGKPAADAPGASDAFESLDLRFALQNQLFRADALSLHSRDVDLVGSGSLATATKALTGKFDMSLSEALSAQAGNDLQRFTREGNRVVLPANLGGTLDSPRVTIDAAAAAKRGLRNEVEQRLKGLLDRFSAPRQP
jgi:hypothetical protein